MSKIPWAALLSAAAPIPGTYVVRYERATDRELMAALMGAGPPGQCKGGCGGSKRSRETSPRYERTRTGNTRLKRRKRKGRR